MAYTVRTADALVLACRAATSSHQDRIPPCSLQTAQPAASSQAQEDQA
jgi:hypothetical protein